MHYSKTISVRTRARGSYEITSEVQRIVADAGVADGLCTVFVHHTSASLMVCENADPSVLRDLDMFMARLVRDGDPSFTHTTEGDDDMAAHVRSVLTQVSIGIPVSNGRCALGTWQGIFLWEHRTRPHSRKVTVTVIG
jgi:secondary thiamine-phosphate synthase enzyme